MSRLAYLDCVGGAAGDMLLGALLDAGADLDYVREGLRSLPVEGLDLRVWTEERHRIGAMRVTVVTAPERVERTWADVRALIEQAKVPERVRARALDVFRRLAEAEAKVHRTEPERIHFHEVGAADAIGDVCGIALALEDLRAEEVACSPLPAPRGFVNAAHGRLPLPAPATLELLRGAPLRGVELDVELVTPTGAAAIAALVGSYGPLPPMRLESVGYGAGGRDLEELPNVLRALIGEPLPGRVSGSEVSLIETNLDDLSPELAPDATAACFEAGALDVWITPVQMKKGRPGFVLSALARAADERRVAEAMLRETTTLGVRVSSARRVELEREWRTVQVEGERVRVKLASLDGEPAGVLPEHDDCAAVARRTGRPVKDVWAAALAAGERGEAR